MSIVYEWLSENNNATYFIWQSKSLVEELAVKVSLADVNC